MTETNADFVVCPSSQATQEKGFVMVGAQIGFAYVLRNLMPHYGFLESIIR